MIRYPLDPLIALMGVGRTEANRVLRISGKTEQEYRTLGVSALVADRLAVRAGFDAYVVWPELLADVIASVERECAAPDCTERFIPGWKAGKKRYCSDTCKKRMFARRRYWTNPESKRARQRAYDRMVAAAKREREARRAS